MRNLIAAVLLPFGFAGAAIAQDIDPGLMAEINEIQAVDNHTHVPKLVAPGEKDMDSDALPCSGYVEPSPDPLMARQENPRYVAAWRQLYGYKHQDMQPEHVQELIATRQKVMAEQGDKFPSWVLDKLGIEYMLANRISMGRGLDRSRFPWVPYVDALLLPFDTRELANSPDRKFFYGREAGILTRFLADAKLTAVPGTLSSYMRDFVIPIMQKIKADGAVAVKFEAAYLRSLNFGDTPEAEASAIYSRYVKGGAVKATEYLRLQDFIFRKIALEAGRQKLAIHIHTGAGCGSYFFLSGSNPTLLDSVLNDSSLRQTNFVLIHGGAGPFTKEAAFLMGKPNVYADFSEQDWFSSARTLSAVLRYWLEWYPEKVMFGTDTFPGPPEMDWDVTAYQITTTAREALAMALTSMVRDKEITRERASALARIVLRENAIKLYGLKR